VKYLTKCSHSLSMLLCVFALTACSMNKGDDVVVTSMPDEAAMSPAPTSHAVPKKEYGVLPNFDYQISNASNGDVTVYSLDGAPPAITPRIQPNMTPPPVMAAPLNNNIYQRPSNSPRMARLGSGSSADEQIFFKFGSSRLGSIDKQKISKFAEKAKFAPINHVTVEGYASRPTQAGEGTVESHILNLKESMNRSFAVSKSLMRNGLPAEKIKTVSHGSVKSTGDDVYDRRVDMYMGAR